jgi:hypothetical protein
MTTQTARQACRKLNKEKKRSEETKIYQLLTNNQPVAFTDRQISFTTNLTRHIVWSRRNNLAKKGLILYAGIVHDPVTGCDVQSWKAKPP